MANVGKLISPGAQISNVYYDESSLHRSVDDVVFDNRFTSQFVSLTFGSQAIALNIPNDRLVGECIVAMRFPATVQVAPAVLGLVPVPAYAVINQIEWQIGGSTIYRETGINHMWSVLADCESQEKRDEVCRLAGGAGYNSGAGYTPALESTYYAHIRTPWSSINGSTLGKMPMDSLLVNQPLRIVLYLNSAIAVYFNITSPSASYNTPVALSDGFFQVRQGTFMNRDHHLKLKYEMIDEATKSVVQKNDFYAYPFIYNQSFISQQFAGSTIGSSPAQIPLTGFRSGNLLSIMVMLYNATTSKISIPATASTNYLAVEDPLSVSLFFNGLELFRSKYDSWKMLGLENQGHTQYARTTPGNDSIYYWLEIPIAQRLSEITEGWQQGINVSSQTLILQMNTLSTNQYVAYITYKYHAHAVFDGSNCEIAF